MKRIAVGASALAALLVISAYAADDLKSGPQVGENGRPKPFDVLNINNGKAKNCANLAGKKTCSV